MTLLKKLPVILIIALSLRLYSFSNYIDHRPEQALGAIPFLFEPGNIAFSIVSGHGFASPFRIETGPTAWMTPIYPEILAGIFLIFGKYTYAAFLAAALLNIAFSTLTCIPLFLVGKRIGGIPLAALSTWLWAIFPQSITLPYETLFDASMSAFLAATILWATFAIAQSATFRHWTTYGLFWGFAVMVNAALASLLPFLLGWTFWLKRRWKQPALAAALAILCCVPWTIRNYAVFHTFVPLRTVMGLSLWLGNNEHADGTSTSNLHPISNSKERSQFIEQGEIAYNQKKQNEAIRYMLDNPGRTLQLSGRRFVAIWSGGSVHPLEDFLNSRTLWIRWVIVFNVLAALLGAAGIVILFQTGNQYAFPVAVFPLIYALPYYVTLAPPRYRHPLDPILLLLAAVSLQTVWQTIYKRSRGVSGRIPNPRHRSQVNNQFSLSFGLSFEDLYRQPGLARIDELFLHQLEPALRERLIYARELPEALAPKQRSELIVDLAPHVEDFIGVLFNIGKPLAELQARHHELAPLYSVKRRFVQRKALTGQTPEKAREIDGFTAAWELEAYTLEPITEMSFARHVDRWLQNEAEYAEPLRLAARYAVWATLTPEGKARHRDGVLFKTPHKLDMHHLVPAKEIKTAGLIQLQFTHDHWRHREGFQLTDPGTGLIGALDQAHYCIKCHNQGKDSCSTGLREKDGTFKASVFGVKLAGCPLEEKISEMNTVKEHGNPIGALAVVTVDNPMAAATGHRICNDCMKSCIFQKQEPVDIPQVETRTLKDVLELPWGFEIYSLLTRWNPLNFERPVMRSATGHKVLVVGLGPAGFTLAHHLMNDGHVVAAVDGLKIEPLPADISGVDPLGNRVPFRPVHDITEIYERLDERVMAGFGGVAEYGITVRWNKNFLKVIRLLLERRAEFSMYGGVRFGGTLTVDTAFELGFDHIALCAGAGRPTVIPMKNGLVRGVRQASDFLMALQLTGAAKFDSLANLQIRMPIVVIGGGLTAIDTATESLAYYIVQVEKFLRRYEVLADELGDAAVRLSWTPDETVIAAEFLAHARAIRAERAAAEKEGRSANLIDLLNSWGGVTVAYRRRLIDAPSYTLNHEEVSKAFEEGVRFAECLAPEEVLVDAAGAADALRFKQTTTGEMITLPARTILVAAGTQPNTVLAREDDHNVSLDGRYFQAVDESGHPVKPEKISKPETVHVLMSLRPDGRALSFFGDLHPSFSGNVVKAMGSAKQGYPVVSRVLSRLGKTQPEPADLIAKLNDELRPTVHDVVRLTPTIVEVIVRAPIAARAFLPGQFYRLQNYEALAPRSHGANMDTILGMEGLALTGASVDFEKGLLSTIVLEMGGSSDLCAMLKPGEPVILMGPTGTPSETPAKETVLLAGGGLGNAVLFSIGQKLREEGSRVIYFAGYKKIIDRYKVEEIEKAADLVIWVCDEAPGFTAGRVQDIAFVGNIVEAMAAYGRGELGEIAIPLNTVDRLIVIGSDGMMKAVQQARHAVLRPYLKPNHHAIGSINSPMQCMMKEICAQCLQMHKDPITGEETVVFSCFNQDQPLDHVDFGSLRTRLSQNGAQEKVTKLWIDHCLRDIGARVEAV